MGGDPPAVPAGETTQQMLEAYAKNFPALLQATNAGAVPTAQAELAAAQASSPGMAALQAQLFQAFGPQLSQTGSDIAAQQAMSQAKSDAAVLAGPGKDVIAQALGAQRLADPEYYAQRTAVGNNLDRLFASINPSGTLSAGENEALSRGLAQQNEQRGLGSAPSQTAALQGAMTFGNAQHQRQTEGIGQLANALSVANQALPALKSGTDVFQVATGRSSQPNSGVGQFTGVQQGAGQAANQLGGNLLGQIGQLTQQQQSINANRRDALDRSTQVISSL